MPLLLDPTAIDAMRDALAAPDPDAPVNAPASVAVRIAVGPGGCSGFKYAMTLESEIALDDQVIRIDGVTVVVDPFSAPHLEGTRVSYKRAMMGEGFAFENPNAAGGCGCGKSFST